MKDIFTSKIEKREEKPRLHGTFVNEIFGLAMRLQMNRPEKIGKYLEREDTQKKHSEQEKQSLSSEIQKLDEKVDELNLVIDKYNLASGGDKDEIKQEILSKCDGIIDLLYGDDPQKEMVKRNIR
jgi:peptidoglycan hydrolase CwlO-like protein